jgi:hypothetical protein
VGDGGYEIKQEFDGQGRLQYLTYPASTGYPSGLKVEYRYSGTGYLNEVRNTAGPSSYWHLSDLSPTLRTQTFGPLQDVLTERQYLAQAGFIMAGLAEKSASGGLDGTHPDQELQRLRREVSLARLIEGQGHTLTSQGKDLACRCPWHDGDDTP